MFKKILFVSGSVAALAVPALVFAQTYNGGSTGPNLNYLNTTISDTGGLVQQSSTVLNYVIGALITIAIIVFIFNVIRFILSKNAEKQKEARTYMLYSVIAIAVILGIFGLASFLLNTFGISSGGLQGSQIPTVPTATTQ